MFREDANQSNQSTPEETIVLMLQIKWLTQGTPLHAYASIGSKQFIRQYKSLFLQLDRI